VPLINLGQEAWTMKRGDRIAQLVLAPVSQAQWQAEDTLGTTARGEQGFGSTGH
jgi:dUTP pyrophosphatase